MPGYVLDGAGLVELPRQPLAVAVTALDLPVAVRAMTADGEPAPGALYPRPGFMVLPHVGGEIVIVARPHAEGTAFPQGTVLQATLGVDSSRTADPDRAELTPLDVSGLHHVELATVTPAGERLAVAARKTAVDVPLTELGARARSAARGVLGVDRLPVNRRVDVEVDIDTTMSMLPLIDDGSVREVVDLLTGVASVIGNREELRVTMIGRSATPLPAHALREVAGQVQNALNSAGLGVGFRSASVDRSGYTTPTLVFTVTDAVPADHAATGVPGVRRRPVVLSGEGAAVVDGSPSGTRRQKLDDPDQLFATVKSLVAGLAVAGESEGTRR
ncbi:hypothetical protein AB0J79_09905 [Rhodococcus coprophilus]|uniref:hypothetical protein n=1 Tax=Rhodococcus coprophilus TaxID=38310 RepID=UPI00343D8909